jgi:hypothetical protein
MQLPQTGDNLELRSSSSHVGWHCDKEDDGVGMPLWDNMAGIVSKIQWGSLLRRWQRPSSLLSWLRSIGGRKTLLIWVPFITKWCQRRS